jgi:hypothetical protein
MQRQKETSMGDDELKPPPTAWWYYVTPEEREANLGMSMADSLASYDDGRHDEFRERCEKRAQAAWREYESRLAEHKKAAN